MKAIVVHDWITKMRGAEKVLESILEVFPKVKVLTLLSNQEIFSSKIKEHEVQNSFIQKLPFSKYSYAYLLPLMPFAVETFNVKKYDLVVETGMCGEYYLYQVVEKKRK